MTMSDSINKEAMVIELYRKGYTDEEIVEMTGLCLASVCELIDSQCG